jgi:hypothetical protein
MAIGVGMKTLVLRLTVFAALALGSTLAQAKGVVSTCHLEGRIDLSANTEYHCTKADQDFVIAPNTLIVTHGFALTIFTLNNIQLDLTVRSFEEDHSAKSQNAAIISIAALSADGNLKIFNDGLGEEGQSGDVSLKFLSVTKGFKKSVILDASEATVRIDIENQG